uniref:Uncharacterized protein n=1 Tax=Pyxicephalus adspersus TaxID=30357 RepID=A0AAV3B4C2_PYXAD|nr:TPA: hypothetical protein GDO54_007734 [Pyxicephalus adspersus]
MDSCICPSCQNEIVPKQHVGPVCINGLFKVKSYLISQGQIIPFGSLLPKPFTWRVLQPKMSINLLCRGCQGVPLTFIEKSSRISADELCSSKTQSLQSLHYAFSIC